MLQISNLTKTFGTKTAVNNLSLSVKPGQICAFIGHNGAGKTTTLKAISNVLDFDNGTILVNGLDVSKHPIESKMQIGFLPDNPELYENLKGIDYLNFIANIFNVSKQDRQERIEHYSKRLSIYENLKQPISSYSHGMKQKLALVSVFLHKPKLYLFDEPFVGLDPVSSHELKKMMDEECANGSAFFYSTHVLDVAEKICSHVAIIKDGKLVGSGTMKEVMGDKSLEKIFLELEKGQNA